MQSSEMLLYLSIAGLVVILFYYFFFFLALDQPKHTSRSLDQKSISVVLCARNELQNLKQFLPKFLLQDHENFEVIVVNDRSSDGTQAFLQEMSDKDERLRVIQIVKGQNDHGKKGALLVGLTSAEHEYIVVSDGDCYPVSDQWLKLYDESFSENKVVLGYGPYEKVNGFLNALIRFDTMTIAAQYLSFALKGVPYMGVGRNLGYKKDLISEQSMGSHLHVKSGDDDLLIQEISNHKNTVICMDRRHWTLSVPKKTWKSYWKQKRRHLTTGRRYRSIHKLLLSALPISLVGFYFLCGILLFKYEYRSTVIMMLSVKVITQFIVYWKISRYLGEKDLVLFSPILEFISVLYNAFAASSLLLTKKVEWK
ncbi:MAG: glycosyltransferase [Flavobacteriales bacterium]|nr:glycosyltransferase [Flavobacteriales bacterium]